MAYVKPFAASTLAKKYKETGLAPETIGILKEFFISCACLYGEILAVEAWHVYQVLAKKEKLPKVRQREFYQVLDILRRDGSEDWPYKIVEISEIWGGERNSPGKRVILHRVLDMGGWYYSRFSAAVTLDSNRSRYAGTDDNYIPDDFLSYREIPESEEEKALIQFLGPLRISLKLYKKKWEKEEHTYENAGRRLDECSYLEFFEDLRVQRFRKGTGGKKKDPGKADQLEAEYRRLNTAEKIVSELKRDMELGETCCPEAQAQMIGNLESRGVELSDPEKEKLNQLVKAMNDHMMLWCNYGWPPAVQGDAFYRNFAIGRRQDEIRRNGYDRALNKIIHNPDLYEDEKMILIRQLNEKFFSNE